jgi:hypothetical protein
LPAEQQKKDRTDNKPNSQRGPQTAEASQRPLARGDNSEHDPYNDKRDANHHASFQRSALLKESESASERVQPRLNRH